MPDYAAASRTKDHHKEQLFREHPEIVSIAPSWKVDDRGRRTGDAVIVIGISARKLSRLGRRRRDGLAPIPGRLEVVDAQRRLTGEYVEVVVEDHGDVVAHGLTDRVRPCGGGYSIGNYRGTTGTLGGVVRLGDGAWCGLLGNGHVLAALGIASKGEDIYQPGPVDGGSDADVVARLEAWVPLAFDGSDNEVDCAVARALDPCDTFVVRDVYGIGVPAMVGTGAPDQAIRKCGKATAVTTGVIASDNADVVVSYIMGLEARFVGQLKYSTMAGPGDSGSLLWDRDSLTVVGMHVGADAAHGYGNHITKVLAALGVALV
jgi:hypothetical protein